jgi:hypothetical protein
VPGRKETRQRLWRHRFDFAAQCGERSAPQHAQHVWMAVLAAFCGSAKFAGDHITPRGETIQRFFDRRRRCCPALRGIGSDERHVRARVAPEQ